MLGNREVNFTLSRQDFIVRHQVVWRAQDRAARECGAKLLDPTPYLCDESKCYAMRNNRPLYFGKDHLSMYGSVFLTPMFAPVFAAQEAKRI